VCGLSRYRAHQHRVQDIHRGEVNFWWNTLAPFDPARLIPQEVIAI
jgi:hypothetical protein